MLRLPLAFGILEALARLRRRNRGSRRLNHFLPRCVREIKSVFALGDDAYFFQVADGLVEGRGKYAATPVIATLIGIHKRHIRQRFVQLVVEIEHGDVSGTVVEWASRNISSQF